MSSTLVSRKNLVMAALIIAVGTALLFWVDGVGSPVLVSILMTLQVLLLGILMAKSGGEGQQQMELQNELARLLDNSSEMAQITTVHGHSMLLLSDRHRVNQDELIHKTGEMSVLSELLLKHNSDLHKEAWVLSTKAIESFEDVRESADAVESVSKYIETMASKSEEARANTDQVAEAEKELSSRIEDINVNFKHVVHSADTVSDAVVRMTDALKGIRERCGVADKETALANGNADAMVESMGKLSASVLEIDKILGVIRNITDKTNMLALNASIEAAGAGEAGKGFAVVANEVKELAQQTADSTRMIASQSEAIQSLTREVGQAIEMVSKNVDQINEINGDISRSVVEQDSLVQEISSSMDGMTQAVEVVTRDANAMEEKVSDVTNAAMVAYQRAKEISETAAVAAQSARDVSDGSKGAAFKTEEVQKTINSVLNLAAEIQKQTLKLIYTSQSVRSASRSSDRLAGMLHDASSHFKPLVEQLSLGDSAHQMAEMKQEFLDWLDKTESIMSGQSTTTAEDHQQATQTKLGEWVIQDRDQLLQDSPHYTQLKNGLDHIHKLALSMAQFMGDISQEELAMVQDRKTEIFSQADDSASDSSAQSSENLQEHFLKVEAHMQNKSDDLKEAVRAFFKLLDEMVEHAGYAQSDRPEML
ncbi:MAG: hypothetical protein HQL53_06810 [Magnetococcales bacterium]|nr:hypothetical protein [Magnetococcales bacterium]